MKRKNREDTSGPQTYYSTSKSPAKGKPLADHLKVSTKSADNINCRNCGKDNHITKNCRWLGLPRCDQCGWFGNNHTCRQQKRKADSDNGGRPKRAKQEQVHHAAEEEGTSGGCNSSSSNEIVFTTEEADGACNFDYYNPLNGEDNDERLLFYDWLADSATTSHVTNMRDAFSTFEPLTKSVSGVGNAQASAKGKGNIKITTKVVGREFHLTLKDVLYIPTNPQNLISLGRWDKSGGTYTGSQGILTMNTGDGQTVIKGKRISNNLYRLNNFTIQKLSANNQEQDVQIFNVTEPPASWETWHCRFGHLGKSSIQALADNNLVTGLNIDLQSPKYDCEACTQAKQHVAPFPKEAMMTITKPGELTHTDLWGKYPVQSIHGNQYFHTFLDDSTKRPGVRFLKHKNDSAQAIRDYVTYVKARGMHPHAFRCDQGKEFINDELIHWLKGQGIELQMTAPYSPSQNGAAERLNRTLVELARAMMIAQNVPMFLWEYTIQHAAYLRERAPAQALLGKTPYEAWNSIKPDVSHLREFSSPVYILLQEQKRRPKLLPRSKQQIFVGYDDGSKSVKYYNPETRKVLTSRNFKFLTHLPPAVEDPEIIQIDPVIPREGEPGIDTLNAPENEHKRQRDSSESQEDGSPQRKLRTKAPVNYKHLNSPFPHEGDDNNTYFSIVYQATLGPDDPNTLREAKTFKDWPEWDKAIRVELEQLVMVYL